ncbi:unnamed protein product [Peniophora sp. CBMAI 1063]|nr:unnamed protein product [Peniophora sp. CBMAI 1063]
MPSSGDTHRGSSACPTPPTVLDTPLPGCSGLESGVPAPDSTWVHVGIGTTGRKVPCLDRRMVRTWVDEITREGSQCYEPRPLSNVVGMQAYDPTLERMTSPLTSNSTIVTTARAHEGWYDAVPLNSRRWGSVDGSTSDGQYEGMAQLSLYSPGASHYRCAPSMSPRAPLELGRLYPVDPSAWDDNTPEYDVHTQADTTSNPLSRTASPPPNARLLEMKPKRTRERRRGKNGVCSTPRDNDPPPFNLDEASFIFLKERLWRADKPLPPTMLCRFNNCGRTVPMDESRLRAHFVDRHDTFTAEGRTLCRWTDEQGQECGAFTDARNYRIHVLDVHLHAFRGQCEVCHSTLINPGGMKRHLKRCLSDLTVDDMWRRFAVRIVQPADGDLQGDEGNRHARIIPSHA